MARTNLLKLTEEVRNFHKSAQEKAATAKAASQGGGAVSVPEKDDRACSAPTPPKKDGDDPNKLMLPRDSRPENNKGVPDGVTDETSVGGTGDNVPKPAITTKPDEVPIDKYAKAKALANSIQGFLHKVAEDKNTPADPAASPAPKPTPNTTTGIPADSKAQKEAANTNQANQVELSDDYFSKIGMAFLSTEKGVSMVRDYLTEQAGVQEANELLKSACEQRDHFLEQIRMQQEFEKAAAEQAAAEQAFLEEILKSASAEDVAVMVKIAEAHARNLDSIKDNGLYTLLYKQGMADAAMMQQSMAGPEGGDPAAGLEAGGEPTIEGGDGVPTIEQIAQLLAMMVESGEIDPATAEQVLAALVGEDVAADPAADPAAGAAALEDPTKAAAAKSPTDIYSEMIGAEYFNQ